MFWGSPDDYNCHHRALSVSEVANWAKDNPSGDEHRKTLKNTKFFSVLFSKNRGPCVLGKTTKS